MGKWKHRLLEIDETSRTATCAACGPVKIRRANSKNKTPGWRCSSPVTHGNGWKKFYEKHGCYPNSQQARHGISKEEIDTMLESQGGACAICGGPPVAFGKYVIDHDHKNGNVRGLLCSNCNAGIGLLGDRPDVAEEAARYLRKHQP